MKRDFLALILAAGKGTRFRSAKNKALHPILGKPLLRIVLDTVLELKPAGVGVVVGYQKEEVMKGLKDRDVRFIHQLEQLGTAHAVRAAEPFLKDGKSDDLLVAYADLPLLTPQTLRALLASHRKQGNSLTLLSAEVDDPSGYGRIVRQSGGGFSVVEEKEAPASVRRIREVNGGVYAFKISHLLPALRRVTNANRKKEFYLTDVVGILARQKRKVGLLKAPDPEKVLGINTRMDLARAAEVLRMRKIRSLAARGVTIYDPGTTWIDLDAGIGADSVLHCSVIIQGKTVVGEGCEIHPFVHLINSRIGDRVRILTSTVIEESVVENDARVGPFTHLRSKSVLRPGSRVGNFVEMKNTVFGKRSKAGHLSYLGDCEIEEDVNIGAGTITCNYDGVRKHRTTIEAGAFIGSGTQLVAPVRVGRKAYVGAGSTITKNVSPGALAVARGRQIEKPGWTERKRKKGG